MKQLLILLALAAVVLGAQTQPVYSTSCLVNHHGEICSWEQFDITDAGTLGGGIKWLPVTRDHIIKIWHWDGQVVSTASSWAALPAIGFEYAVLCYKNGSRRRVHGADFYCWPSSENPDGLTRSLPGEALGAFIHRTECRLNDVRFGLMMTDREWKKVEKEALAHTCEAF